MKIKFLLLLALIILTELFVIGFLAFRIHEKQKKVLGAVSVNPIKKETIVFNPQSKLKHFYEPKPNSTVKDTPSWLTYEVTYTINSDSLNEKFDYSIDKPNGVFRIIALGDSFTYGVLVDTKDNWTEFLEDKLNKITCKNIKKFEIINLGVSAYDIQYAVERFRLRGKKYNPDLVLWLLKNDDFLEVTGEEAPLKDKYLDSLKKEGNYSDEKLATRGGQMISNNLLSQAWDLAYNDIEKRYGHDQLVNLQKSYLEEIHKYFSKRLLIFTIKEFLDKPYEDLINNVVSKYPGDIFLNDSFSKYDGSDDSKYTFLPYNYHPNQEGHKVIAEDLFNYLTKNKIIPCN